MFLSTVLGEDGRYLCSVSKDPGGFSFAFTRGREQGTVFLLAERRSGLCLDPCASSGHRLAWFSDTSSMQAAGRHSRDTSLNSSSGSCSP